VANHLTMALVDTIRSLHERGWSQQRIAEELGIHRETVARHLGLAADSKPANAPIGSGDELKDSKPANAPTGDEEESSSLIAVNCSRTRQRLPKAKDLLAASSLFRKKKPANHLATHAGRTWTNGRK